MEMLSIQTNFEVKRLLRSIEVPQKNIWKPITHGRKFKFPPMIKNHLHYSRSSFVLISF